MYSNNPRAKWWQLYLAFPLLILLFLADHSLRISARGHEAVQIGSVLVVYGLIHLWIKANSAGLRNTEAEPYFGAIMVTRISLPELPESDHERRQRLDSPDSEIRGVLADTFGMDCIDAEAHPVDAAPRNADRR
ncbi:MAG: hypothetical protein ACM3QS_03690 [Bacteroidota bacterium]